MKFLLSLVFVLCGFQYAQAQSSSNRMQIKQTLKSTTKRSAKPDYRFTMNFNNSRLAKVAAGNQNKLRKTGFEFVRVFDMAGMPWESGLAYETLGGRFVEEGFSSAIEISYLTIPLLRRSNLGRVGDFDVVAIWGGRLAIQSEAEVKDTVVLGSTSTSQRNDLEEFVEEYDIRSSLGISLESKAANTLGFSTGLQWQRGTRNLVEGTGPKSVIDTLAFNIGMLF